VTLGSGEGALAVPLNVTVPDSYSSTVSGRRRVPLLISLVPTWTNIRTEPLVWSRVAEPSGAILASIALPAGRSWNDATLAVALVDAVIADLSASFAIDRSRVFLTAASDSTDAAWQAAGHRADRFAGLIVRAATAPPQKHIAAMHHLPILAIHGSADERAPLADLRKAMVPMVDAYYDVTLAVQRGRKHETFADAAPVISEWMRRRVRPASAWQTAAIARTPAGNTGYWVEIAGVRDSATAEWLITDPANAETIVERRVELTTPATITASRGQIGNTNTVTTENVSRVRIHIDERVLPAERAIAITLNGKSHTITPDALGDRIEAMLEHARRTGDRSGSYAGVVELTVE
jgi:hypothetical protein